MDEKKENIELIKLEEISEFKLDEKEFNDCNNKLDEEFKFKYLIDEGLDHHMKFKGNLKNGNYHGRGISYNNGKIEYDGFFKDGKKEGFGRYYFRDYYVVGFFKDDEFKKGIISYKNIKKFECELKDKESFIGIEFLDNGNIKRKMEYEYHKYDFGFELSPKVNSYGILYDDNNNIIYKGLLKSFKPQQSNYVNIYNKNGNKIYSGSISNYNYHGEGIEYYNDSDIIHYKGLFNNQNYERGMMFDPNGNKIYEGILIDNVPKESKNIKLFNLDGNIIYEGDLLDGLYDNNGKIFVNDKVLYNGGFLKGKYNKFGKLYDKDENLIYEGEFLEGKYHGEGNLLIEENIYMNEFGNKSEGDIHIKGKFSKGIIEDNNASIIQNTKSGKYLFFEGSIKNNLYNGFGKIYYKNKNIFFQGSFDNGKIYGKGIKFYKDGTKKIEGIFKNLNSCTGIYFNPEGKEIYNGEIINDIPYNCNNITIYHDNTNKLYEGDIKEGKYEGYGIEYNYFINNKILYEGEYKNNYLIIKDIANLEKERIQISVFSYQHGYPSCEFVEQLITGKTGSFGLATEGDEIYSFKYDDHIFNIYINIFNNLYYRKKGIFCVSYSKIIIIVVTVTIEKNEYYLDEQFISDITESKKEGSLVYVILTGLKKEIDFEVYESARKSTEDLINNKIIDKYFVLNLENGEGLDIIKKNLHVDSLRNINEKNIKISPSLRNKLIKYINF